MNMQFTPLKIEKEKMQKVQVNAFHPATLEVNESNFDPSCHMVVSKENLLYVDKVVLNSIISTIYGIFGLKLNLQRKN